MHGTTPPRRRARRALLALVVLGAGICVSAPVLATGAGATIAGTCAAAGTQVASGSKIISGPMLPAITSATLAISVPVSVQTTTEINPGGTVTSTASVAIDLAPLATDVLVNRVRPAVIAAGYAPLAPTAWDVLALDAITLSLHLPAGVSPVGQPSSTPSNETSVAFGSGTVDLTIAHAESDTRSPAAPTVATMAWVVADHPDPAPRQLVLTPASITFTASIQVGVLFYSSPIVGTVTGPWSCPPDDPAIALATTDVVDHPVTSTTSTTTTTGSSTTRPGTTLPMSTTTWPSQLLTPPGACTVSGFDRFGGYAPVDLGATGFFHTARHDGRWWLVDPDGHPFFSQGLNHVTLEGTPDRTGATPYRDAAIQRYGTGEAWTDAQIARMGAWGYNTLGAWSDDDRFAGRVPYTVLLDLTSQDFGSGVMEDLWAPGWADGVQQKVAAQVATRLDDPALVGYWSDNELHWGPDWRPIHLFDEYLQRPVGSAGRQVLLDFLQQRYPTFASFAADFTTTATTWDELGPTVAATPRDGTGGQATKDAWVGIVAERYFSVTSGAVKRSDPNHLFLGPRMIAQVTGTPVLEAAARHVDVASFNLYDIVPELAGPLGNADPTYLPVDGGLAAQEAILQKPIIISEWSYRAADSGLPNTWPPLFPVLATQQQRAAAYERFVLKLLGTGWVVGQHWFEHSDEPPLGRSDGEDSNFGLVDLADNPYAPLVAVSKTMHDCAYARLIDAEPPATTTTVPASETIPEAEPSAPSTTVTSTTGPIEPNPSAPPPTPPASVLPGATATTPPGPVVPAPAGSGIAGDSATTTPDAVPVEAAATFAG